MGNGIVRVDEEGTVVEGWNEEVDKRNFYKMVFTARASLEAVVVGLVSGADEVMNPQKARRE